MFSDGTRHHVAAAAAAAERRRARRVVDTHTDEKTILNRWRQRETVDEDRSDAAHC